MENQFQTQTAEPSLQGFYQPAQVAQNKVSIEIEETPEIKPRNTINRDAPRYVILLGDYMTPTKKRDFQSYQGVHLGGTWFDVGEVPALWRTQGFITRGKLTPLIKKSQKMDAGEQPVAEGKGDAAVVIGANGESQLPGAFRAVFPYDSLQSIQAIGRVSGIVEVPELHTIDYNSGHIQEIQDFIIPDWSRFMTGDKNLPLLLDESEAMIQARRRSTSEALIQNICDRYLESASVFRVWAKDTIDRNKMGYDKGVNEQGFRQPITELAQMLADQLGIRLNDKQPFVINAGAPQQTAPAVDRDLEERRIAAEERRAAAIEESNRIELLKLNQGKIEPTEGQIKGNSIEIPKDAEIKAGAGSLNQSANEIEIAATKCAAISARTNEPCKNDAADGTPFCKKHVNSGTE